MDKIKLFSPVSERMEQRTLEKMARARGFRLITNSIADRVLTEPLMDVSLMQAWPVCTSTMVAYPASGSKIDDFIEYSSKPKRYVLETKNFRGEKGIALVFENWELRVDGLWNVYIPKASLVAIANFPKENGWYDADASTMIPCGEPLKKRYLWRLQQPRIGPVSRDYSLNGASRFDVFMHHRHTHPFGAIAYENRQADDNVVSIEQKKDSRKIQ